MNNVKCAVLNVGGWFDAEDPMGPLRIYHAVEEKNPGTTNMLVDGAVVARRLGARHGDTLGNLNFAVKTGEFFRENDPVPVLHAVSEGQTGRSCPRRGCS